MIFVSYRLMLAVVLNLDMLAAVLSHLPTVGQRWHDEGVLDGLGSRCYNNLDL